MKISDHVSTIGKVRVPLGFQLPVTILYCLCEPAAGLMVVFDNVPAENASASSVKPKKWSKGKQKEKVNNMGLFDKATFDKLLSEAPKFEFKLKGTVDITYVV
ncbi:40S ribosomal protein S25 [Tanacetum coccineum]